MHSALRYLLPFSRLHETTQSWHSRTLRTGFFVKLEDTFLIFLGCYRETWDWDVLFHDDRSSRRYNCYQGHLGVFDWAFFLVPVLNRYILLGLMNYRYGSSSDIGWAKLLLRPWLTFPIVIVSAVALFFTASRYAFASVATMVFLPIVALVWYGAAAIAAPMKQVVLGIVDNKGKTLADFYKKYSLDFDCRGTPIVINSNIVAICYDNISPFKASTMTAAEAARKYNNNNAVSNLHTAQHELIKLNVGGVYSC